MVSRLFICVLILCISLALMQNTLVPTAIRFKMKFVSTKLVLFMLHTVGKYSPYSSLNIHHIYCALGQKLQIAVSSTFCVVLHRIEF